MNSNDINESAFFDENKLYIIGNDLKASIMKIKEDFTSLGKELFSNSNNNTFTKDNNNQPNISIDYSDIIIKNLEGEVEDLINASSSQLLNSKKKQLFVLNKQNTSKSADKKGNYLRNEAKILEETIKPLQLPSYQTIKTDKFNNCQLNSYHFFKNCCKKEVGKENNYIFNFKDNYLNDMTKIDTLFFQDYFKPQPISTSTPDEIVFEFSIYHPINNSKTQQIAVLGSGKLTDLKDKIYCVLDEIQSGEYPSFFFIENAFYNDLREKKQSLSLNISENKINKLSIKDFELNDGGNKDKEGGIEKAKFDYNGSLYCNKKIENESHIYEDLSMESFSLNDIPMRIGYPYLFRHIESCDHMILLNDVRLRDQYDSFNKEKCVVTYQKKIKRRKCDACLFYYAKFISINDSICQDASHALFLCDYCLKQLHEQELKEQRTHNLKLIPYFHD